MCVIDLEPAEVWRESRHKARTPKRCACCHTQIKPGNMYYSHFSVYEGLPTASVICEPCHADREIFGQAHGLTPTPRAFYNLLLDCITENGDEDPQGWIAMRDRILKRETRQANETHTTHRPTHSEHH